MGHSSLLTGLANWWALDEEDGATLYADKMNRVALIPDGVSQTTWTRGYATEFDSSASLSASSNDFTSIKNRSFTIAFWARFNEVSSGPSQYLLCKFGASGEYFFFFEPGAYVQFTVGASTIYGLHVGTPVQDVWHLIVGIYNKSTGKTYIKIDNRNSVTSGNNAGPVASSEDFVIGMASDGTLGFNGAIANVAIWWRALEDSELDVLWNNGEGVNFEELAESTCKSVACCDSQNFTYNSSSATDASQDFDQQGPPNPNCPAGYVWGGLSCVREQDPQTCSEGYYWDGERCVAEGDSVVCANGFYLSGGECVPCETPAAPTLTAAAGQITLNFNVADGLSYNIFRSNDGSNYTLLASDVGTAAAESYVDNTTTAGITYWYFISVYLNLECGFTDGAVASALAF